MSRLILRNEKFLKNTTGTDLFHDGTGTSLPAGEYSPVRPNFLDRYADEQLRAWMEAGDVVYAESDLGTADITDPHVGWYHLFNEVDLSRNFYVSKSGYIGDADGTIQRPFPTIGSCITYVKENFTFSASQNGVIRVAAGEYVEDTLEPPVFCSIWGHHYRTRVRASSGDIDLIVSTGSHTIKGLLLTGVTDPTKYLVKIVPPVSRRVTLQDLSLSTYEVAGSISNGIYVSATTGTATVRMKQIDLNDIEYNLLTLGPNSRGVIRGMQIFDCPTATFIDATGNSSYSAYNVDLDSVYIGINHQNTGSSDVSNVNLLGADIPLIKSNSSELLIRSTIMNTLNAQIYNYTGITGYFSDTRTGDASFRVISELAVGSSDHGHESVFGEGDSYVIGMKVLTSDGTDTSTTEGSLTDVTNAAKGVDTNYFSFQGTGSGYCIYVTTEVQNTAFGSLDYARPMGIKVSQISAAVETTPKSIVYESWNGSAWVEGSIFSNHSGLFYRYGNDLFIRSNVSEHHRFGRNLILDNSVKKTIFGQEGYWTRIRIKNPVTTAPVFNQFKISNNRVELNADGTITMHGLARYLVALSFQSNTFGETGGVTNANFQVGSGIDFPHDNWVHSMKNNQLNGPNDAIYANAIIPEGCCTSCPLTIKIKYLVLNEGASDDGLLKISLYVAATEGILVADRTGGIEPVIRSTTDALEIDSGAAQVQDITIPLDVGNRVLTATSADFDIDDYYEGDLMLIRIGLQDNGNNKKVAIIGIDVEYLKWTLGSRIT